MQNIIQSFRNGKYIEEFNDFTAIMKIYIPIFQVSKLHPKIKSNTIFSRSIFRNQLFTIYTGNNFFHAHEHNSKPHC